MEKTIKKATYKVTFGKILDKTKIWEFELLKSSAFQYGNGTSCVITVDGEEHSLIDTRYCKSIIAKFNEWCEEFLDSYLRKDIEPKWELMK